VESLVCGPISLSLGSGNHKKHAHMITNEPIQKRLNCLPFLVLGSNEVVHDASILPRD